MVISTSYLIHLLFLALDADDEPVHSLKAVVINSSSIVLTWDQPVDVASDTIQVCATFIPVR